MIVKLNRYPENYEEENMPQVIVEIRYRKGTEASANALAQRIEKEVQKIIKLQKIVEGLLSS